MGRLVPANVEHVWVGTIPTRLARMAGAGDVGLRGYFAIQPALSRQSTIAFARSAPLLEIPAASLSAFLSSFIEGQR